MGCGKKSCPLNPSFGTLIESGNTKGGCSIPRSLPGRPSGAKQPELSRGTVRGGEREGQEHPPSALQCGRQQERGITPTGEGREMERNAAEKHLVGTLPSAGGHLLFSSFSSFFFQFSFFSFSFFQFSLLIFFYFIFSNLIFFYQFPFFF